MKIAKQKIIEKVLEEMCDNYCKYTSEEFKTDSKELAVKCENCPLNQLVGG